MATHSSTLAWKNPMDGGDWWVTVHGVTNSRTQLSDFTSPYSTGNYTQYFVITYLEKESIHLNHFAVHLKVIYNIVNQLYLNKNK